MPPPLKLVVLGTRGCAARVDDLARALVGDEPPVLSEPAFDVYHVLHSVTPDSQSLAVPVEPVLVAVWVVRSEERFYSAAAAAVESADAALICLRGDGKEPEGLDVLGLEVIRSFLEPVCVPLLDCVVVASPPTLPGDGGGDRGSAAAGRVRLPRWLAFRMPGGCHPPRPVHLGLTSAADDESRFRVFFTRLFDAMATLGDGSPACDGRDYAVHYVSAAARGRTATSSARDGRGHDGHRHGGPRRGKRGRQGRHHHHHPACPCQQCCVQ